MDATGRSFTPEQRWRLHRIAEQIGVNLTVAPKSFDTGEFFDRSGSSAQCAAWRCAVVGR